MAENPVEAGVPRTRNITRTYDNGKIRVLWDATRCTHTAICLRALPRVFDAGARPWIDIDGAEPDEVAATILKCPTGALMYDGDAVPAEEPDEPTTVVVRPHGPLYIRGRVSIQRPGGEATEETRVALCRCGESQNKPYCDNSHLLVGFRDPVRKRSDD